MVVTVKLMGVVVVMIRTGGGRQTVAIECGEWLKRKCDAEENVFVMGMKSIACEGRGEEKDIVKE